MLYYYDIVFRDNVIVITGIILGCTNTRAANYMSFATLDDGTCVVHGCMEKTATTYRVWANTNDSSLRLGWQKHVFYVLERFFFKEYTLKKQ